MVKILLVLGNQKDIKEPISEEEINEYFETPERVQPRLVTLENPSIDEFFDIVHQESFDIIIIVGHSHQDDDGNDGRIQINEHENISINQFSQPFADSVKNKGLKLVILAGCSSIGAGTALVTNNINVPNVIVFREPVHYQVLRRFFKLLKSYWIKDSLGLDIAITRIKPNLKIFDELYPGASNILSLLWPSARDSMSPSLMFSEFTPAPLPPPPAPSFWHTLLNIIQSLTHLPKWVKLSGLLICGLILVLVLKTIFSMFIPSNPPEVVSLLQESVGDHPLFDNDYRGNQAYLDAKKNIAESFKTSGELQENVIDKAETLRRNNNFDDPEPIWTINNAKVELDLQKKLLTLDQVITLPLISSDEKGSSTAREAARGAVIAQTEINQSGTPKQKLKFKFRVILDDNDEQIAEKVAKRIVNERKKFPAVIGHFESDASLKAAPIYEESKIVMISPTSSVSELTRGKKFIFRTIPKSDLLANTLANHIIKKDKKKKIGLCFSRELKAADAFEKAFIIESRKLGGEVFNENKEGKVSNENADEDCTIKEDDNRSEKDFNNIIRNMKNKNVDSIVLYFHLNKDYQGDTASKLARAARNNGLTLYGNHGLDAQYTREDTTQSFDGMKIVTPRLGSAKLTEDFTKKFNAIYNIYNKDKYVPTWRDMMAYDAVKAIAHGLDQLDKNDRTSENLQRILRSKSFPIDGSSGPIQFNGQGDRFVTPSIAELKCRLGTDRRKVCKFELVSTTTTN